MPEHIWRPSGLDGTQHAFASVGGYVPTETHTAYLRVSSTLTGDDVYTAATVEVFVAECQHAVPVAFLLPRAEDTAHAPHCEECAHRSGRQQARATTAEHAH